MEYQVGYLVSFYNFLVIDGFRWFWVGSLRKSIQLMLEFLDASFSVHVLHFSHYTYSMELEQIGIKFRKKHIPKVSKFYVEKRFLC